MFILLINMNIKKIIGISIVMLFVVSGVSTICVAEKRNNMSNNHFSSEDSNPSIHNYVVSGDLDGDLDVDDDDFGVLKNAWLSAPGNDNWNSECDFNDDGRINFLDLQLFRMYYRNYNQ